MASNKIRIAFFCDIFAKNTDGVSRTIFNIIENIPSDKFEFLFITPTESDDFSELPWKVISTPAINFPLYPQYKLGFPFLSKRLKKELDSFKPDVIHFTTPSFLGYYAIRYGEKHSIPTINFYHTHFTEYLKYYIPKPIIPPVSLIIKKILSRIYNASTHTFAPSSPLQEFLIDLGINQNKVSVLGRGVDVEKFSPQYAAQTPDVFPFNTDTKKILFVGRLEPEKEVTVLVKLYKAFENSNRDIQFVIVGDGSKLSYLKSKMPCAHFTGKLTGEELSIAYAKSDIFLFPSTTETFGNVIREAMASGVPAVAAKAGGPIDIIKDGENGYLIEPQNINEYVEKLTMLLDNPELLETFSKNAQRDAQSKPWTEITNTLFEKYRELATPTAA